MKSGSYHNILIIKPSALGDIVHALPVLPSLRQAFPHAKLTWMVRKEFAPLLESTEGLDEILLFDRKGMGHWFYNPKSFRILMDFWKRLRNGRFDLVLDLQGLLRSAIFSRMTGCLDRVGLKEAREMAGWFYTRTVEQPNGSGHILDYYFAVLKSIGVQDCLKDSSLTAGPQARESIQRKLLQNQLREKTFVVLVPSSAHAYKCWPTNRFAELAKAFYQQYGFSAVVIGTPSESEYAKVIQSNTDSPVIDLTGQTSIPELIALFQEAAAVISNDTGPGHMALATTTPAVIIFGNTNPLRLGPYQRPGCIVAVDADKRGTEIKDTTLEHKIENVTVEMVMEKIKPQLGP